MLPPYRRARYRLMAMDS